MGNGQIERGSKGSAVIGRDGRGPGARAASEGRTQVRRPNARLSGVGLVLAFAVALVVGLSGYTEVPPDPASQGNTHVAGAPTAASVTVTRTTTTSTPVTPEAVAPNTDDPRTAAPSRDARRTQSGCGSAAPEPRPEVPTAQNAAEPEAAPEVDDVPAVICRAGGCTRLSTVPKIPSPVGR